VSIGHGCPTNSARRRIDFWHTNCDLDLEFWGVKIPRCTSSYADKYIIIQLYGSIAFTFGVLHDKNMISRQRQIYMPYQSSMGIKKENIYLIRYKTETNPHNITFLHSNMYNDLRNEDNKRTMGHS